MIPSKCTSYGHSKNSWGCAKGACDTSGDFCYRLNELDSVQCQHKTMFLANIVPLGKGSL